MRSQRSVTSSTAMRIAGVLAVILGGLVSAAAGPLSWDKGSWAAAYLVLVAGVAQSAMGLARKHWPRPDAESQGWAQFALWNVGNIAIIVGTLAGSTVAVFIGSALLVIALVLAFLGTVKLAERPHATLMTGYRVLLVLLAVSIPIGMAISAIRNG